MERSLPVCFAGASCCIYFMSGPHVIHARSAEAASELVLARRWFVCWIREMDSCYELAVTQYSYAASKEDGCQLICSQNWQ